MFSNHVSTLILCAFTIVINSKRGGALKAGVLIVWYSHVVQALGNVGPRKLGSILSLRYRVEYEGKTVLKTIMRGVSVSTFAFAASLYTGNELEKCLILVQWRI